MHDPLSDRDPSLSFEMGLMGDERDDTSSAGSVAASDGFLRVVSDTAQDKVPRVSIVGRVLGHTGDCFCSQCGGCPTGAIGVLLISLAVSLGTAGYGLRDPQTIANDVDPNTDGFLPRRSEIGNRYNTYTLLFQPDGFRGLAEGGACADEGICLSHHPLASAATTGRRRRELQDGGPPPTDKSGPPPTSAEAEFCSSGCSNGYAFSVVFGSREESQQTTDEPSGTARNLLEPAKLRAMCNWEDQLLSTPSLRTACKAVGSGAPRVVDSERGEACCRPPSVPRVLAALTGKACAALSVADIQSGMASLLACRRAPSANYTQAGCAQFAQPSTQGSFVATRVYDWSRQLCGDDGSHGGLLPNGACPARTDPVNGGGSTDATVVTARWVRVSHEAPLDIGYCMPNPPDDSDRNHDKREFAEFEAWKSFGQGAYDGDGSGGDLPVVGIFRDHILGDVNTWFVFTDLQWAGFSFVLIYGYILVSVQSIWIASLGMLHIFLSFFMSYAIYKACIDWYPFLLWLGLFVICGIGADGMLATHSYCSSFRHSVLTSLNLVPQIFSSLSTPGASRSRCSPRTRHCLPGSAGCTTVRRARCWSRHSPPPLPSSPTPSTS